MGEFVKVATTSEIDDQGVKCVEIGDKTLALFNLGGEFYAIDDACSHDEGPLSEGYVDGDEVECPWHAARFNIKTGKALCEPAYEDVRSYPVRINGDEVEVEIGD